MDCASHALRTRVQVLPAVVHASRASNSKSAVSTLVWLGASNCIPHVEGERARKLASKRLWSMNSNSCGLHRHGRRLSTWHSHSCGHYWRGSSLLVGLDLDHSRCSNSGSGALYPHLSSAMRPAATFSKVAARYAATSATNNPQH